MLPYPTSGYGYSFAEITISTVSVVKCERTHTWLVWKLVLMKKYINNEVCNTAFRRDSWAILMENKCLHCTVYTLFLYYVYIVSLNGKMSILWANAKIFICAFRMPNYQIPLALYVNASYSRLLRTFAQAVWWTPNSEQKAHPFVIKTKKSSVMKLNCFFYTPNELYVYVERASVPCFTHGFSDSFVSYSLPVPQIYYN